ncbi:MAG: uracil-DNA glycosylase [Deltaproteobacteria bacterium]|nr:uracil-DNA glycosylase [Deltaproteobacteria bacterium]
MSGSRTIEERLEAHLLWRLRAGLGRIPASGEPAAAAPAPAPAPTPAPAPRQAARAPTPGSEPRSARPEAPRGPGAGSGPQGYQHGVGSEALRAIRERLGDCERCGLHAGRRNLVFGVGNPAADLVFVGEGPGAEEDRRGEPFVGRAGELLTKMIEAMGYSREQVYICNVVKCRPPGNRDPEPAEVAACEPFLKEQLAALQPKVIVGLGRFAVQSLLGDYQARITRVRGRWATYAGVPLMPTLHPAYLLRNPAAKREAWQDLQAVMKRLSE